MPKTTRVIVGPAEGGAQLTLASGELLPRVVAVRENSAHVALVAGGALLLGGDHVDLEIAVGPGCTLELEEISGTVAYDGRGRAARWDTRITVADGGRLLWQGLPFVVATGADVTRTMTLDLASDATACLREVFVMGRHGEAGGELAAITRVTHGGEPLFVEDLRINGAHRRPGVMGRARIADVVSLYGRRAEAEGRTVALQLAGPGSIARDLGSHAHASPLDSTWQAWRDLATQEMAQF